MNEYIIANDIVNKIKKLISQNCHLHKRKELLLQALFNYNNNKKKIVFSNIIPLQIEGIFYDYCLEMGITEDQISKSSLNNKLERLKNHISYYDYEYFAFRFPALRNKVAHGMLFDEGPNKLADFLLLDLHSVCDMICSDSLEINRTVALLEQLKIDAYNIPLLIKYTLTTTKTLPKFYKVKSIINRINTKLSSKEFWSVIAILAADNDEYIRSGIREVLIYLKQSDIRRLECDKLLKCLNVKSQRSDFEPEYFLYLCEEKLNKA